MIDHLILNVADVAVSRRFYEPALATLGYQIVMAYSEGVGFGQAGKPDFWIARREPVHAGVHVAFRAERRALVVQFHQAALKAGGTDNGAPGLRPHYHKDYFGAFVLDPDGNNVEAVCHTSEE